MKKIFFIGILISSLNIFAQNFPGQHPELLVSKEIKVTDLEVDLQKFGYDGFYKDSNLKIEYASLKGIASKYSALVGKVFKVISCEPYINIIGINKFKLKLENTETGIV